MMMLLLVLFIGLILLYLGAEGLVLGATSLALRVGITPLVAGLTVVAFGTSAPEMVVSVKATLDGQGGIALGNVVGSNIFNIAAIVGLSALIRPLTVKAKLIAVDSPLMIGVSFLCLFVFANGKLGRTEAAFLSLGIIAYTMINLVMARRAINTEVAGEFADGISGVTNSVWMDIVYILGGLVLLVVGAHFLVDSAIHLARLWGASEAIIGLTIVAAGTSLPELATSVVAAIRKQADIAVGNVVGSNIFNILAILGVSGLIRPFEMGGVAYADIYWMLAVAAILLVIMFTHRTISRREGVLLLLIYGGYLFWLWPAS